MAQIPWHLGPNLEVRVQSMNGEPFLSAGRMKPHRGQVGRNLLALFEYLGQVAPPVLWPLYVLDDEHSPGSFQSYDDGQDDHTVFQVFVLSRGVLRRQADPLLLPFVPVVEDPSPD
jgi:hypothetical protein